LPVTCEAGGDSNLSEGNTLEEDSPKCEIEDEGSQELRRPYIRDSVRAEVEENSEKTPDGKFIDPNTSQPIEGKPDLGHVPGHEFWREKQEAEANGMTQEQFNDHMNDPKYYQLEDPSSNRGHVFEDHSPVESSSSR
jgi:hypothetical protein